MSTYPELFAPMRIGTLELRNRIVSSAHGERMSEDHLVSEREIAYYEEKARGGAGLVVLDGVRTALHTAPNRNTLIGTLPEQAARYRALADALHRHGCKVFGQMLHQGALGTSFYSRQALVSASPIASAAVRETPHELSAREIRAVIDDFVETARIMKEGGLDGIEIHAAHGYLVGQFLSPLTNRRDDEYGGSAQNRRRFGCELLAAVRDAIGPQMPFGIRINADDLVPGGCGPAEMLETARDFVAAGELDFLSVSAGTYHGEGPSIMVGDHGYAPGFIAGNSRAFKEAFPQLAVITVGRIVAPALAEAIVARGDADMVCVTRGLIADPQWPAKAAAGQPERIRPCIACNTCLTMNRAITPITCAVNPACGEERRHRAAQARPVSQPRRVVVIGGGVAGMEAARSAAELGHRVVLHERREELGGQVALLARTRHRAELRGLLDYYRTELARLGVEVRTGSLVDAGAARAFDADLVIVATGAVGRRTDAWGDALPVLDAIGLLEHGVPTGARSALLVDREYGHGAPSIAHHLRDEGLSVTYVTEHPMIGADLPPGGLPGVLKRLLGAGIDLRLLSTVHEVGAGTVVLRHALTGATSPVPGVDAVVVVGERRSEDAIVRALQAEEGRIVAIGDARAPRMIWQAVREGFLALRSG